MDNSDRDILDSFVSEAGELLDALERDVLALDDGIPEHIPGLIDDSFRRLHSIKGTASMCALNDIEHVAQEMEQVLERVRGASKVPPEIVETLLWATDALRTLVEPSDRRVDVHAVVATLRDAVSGCAAPTATEPAPPVTRSMRVPRSLLETMAAQTEALDQARHALRVAHDDASRAEALERIDDATDDLIESVRRTRRQPADAILAPLTRLARDLERRLDRRCRLLTDGGDAEIDRAVLDALRQPLLHVVRNAIDHGIEPPTDRRAAGKPGIGTVHVHVELRDGRVCITIEDDGAGFDPQGIRARAVEVGILEPDSPQIDVDRAIELALFPGVTTAVAANAVSGRGVGLDVVRVAIERLGGELDVTSRAGHGTTVRITAPLETDVVQAVLFRAGEDRWALPRASVAAIVQLRGDGADDHLVSTDDGPALLREGVQVPLHRPDGERAHSILGSHTMTVLVADTPAGRIGILADQLEATHELMRAQGTNVLDPDGVTVPIARVAA